MGMAAWGNPNKELQDELRELLSINLHRGCLGWDSKVYPDDGTEQWKFDIAHNTQVVNCFLLRRYSLLYATLLHVHT